MRVFYTLNVDLLNFPCIKRGNHLHFLFPEINLFLTIFIIWCNKNKNKLCTCFPRSLFNIWLREKSGELCVLKEIQLPMDVWISTSSNNAYDFNKLFLFHIKFQIIITCWIQNEFCRTICWQFYLRVSHWWWHSCFPGRNC